MTKQFFLIKLSDDRSKYKDQDWESLIDHIKNHDGKDTCWTVSRFPKSSSNLLEPVRDSIRIFCDSFKSALTTKQVRELIQDKEEDNEAAQP